MEPRGSDPTDTGEVASEGGSPGDLLRSSVRPGRDDAERQPGGVSGAGASGGGVSRVGVPGLVWVALLVPIVLVLLWFATSLG